jgi:hypothetical protein
MHKFHELLCHTFNDNHSVRFEMISLNIKLAIYYKFLSIHKTHFTFNYNCKEQIWRILQ